MRPTCPEERVQVEGWGLLPYESHADVSQKFRCFPPLNSQVKPVFFEKSVSCGSGRTSSRDVKHRRSPVTTFSSRQQL